MGKLSDFIRGSTKVVITAKEVKAARVLYESEDIQRVEAQIVLPEGEILILELNRKQVQQLAQELVSCYRAMGYEFKM